MSKHTKEDLKQMQALPFEYKLEMTKQRIKSWYESWVKFEIINKKTGKQRFEVCDVRNSFNEPNLKNNEYISNVYDGQVYVSFSGGKDSTVLLHIARELYPDIEAVYINTGLEYPEIQRFVRTINNVTILRPEMRFDEVIKTYGYPMIGKEVSQSIYDAKTSAKNSNIDVRETNLWNRGFNLESEHLKKYPMYSRAKFDPLFDLDFNVSHKCCDIMKKHPAKIFEKQTGKKPILATMAEESKARRTEWMKKGCNAFDEKRPKSNPMSFWTEQDVLYYIKKYNISIADIYGDVQYLNNPEQIRIIQDLESEILTTTGVKRTGCVFCGFGCHLENNPNRFEKMKSTHPRQYDYCINGGEYNDDGIWIPNRQGLGMKHVFDELNNIYGDDFIKY